MNITENGEKRTKTRSRDTTKTFGTRKQSSFLNGRNRSKMMKETLEKLLKEHYYKTSLCKVFPTYEDFIQKWLIQGDKKARQIVKEISEKEIPEIK